jgi:RHS repeat-associated protein
MKYTGHERDSLASNPNTLDYMHARYYNPTAGRFLSVDPVLGNPSIPQSWNRYAYVQNNPINRTDPKGLCGEGGGFVGPVVPCTAMLSPPKNASNWTAAQRSAENAKNAERAQLAEQGKLVVNRGQARPSSSQVADVNGGPASSGSHLDHKQELVLGGAPLAKENIGTLDATVNMSNGARVKNAIAGLADGTVITKFNYTMLSWGGALTTITQGISYSTFMSNQDAAHPGSVNVDDMARWVFTGNTSASPPLCGSPGGGPC